jgi:hypothetical protein
MNISLNEENKMKKLKKEILEISYIISAGQYSSKK